MASATTTISRTLFGGEITIITTAVSSQAVRDKIILIIIIIVNNIVSVDVKLYQIISCVLSTVCSRRRRREPLESRFWARSSMRQRWVGGRAKGNYGVAAALSSVRRFLARCRTSFRQPANGLSPLRAAPTIHRWAGGRPTGLLAAATSHTRRRCRVLFLTRLAARPTVARAPRRPSTVDELGERSAGGRAPFRHRTRDRPYRIRRLMRAAPKSAFCAPLDGRRPGRGPSTCFVSYLM